MLSLIIHLFIRKNDEHSRMDIEKMILKRKRLRLFRK
jgi:hypothetical protein